MICQYCGAEIGRRQMLSRTYAHARAGQITRMQRQILGLLLSHRDRPVSLDHMMHFLYSDRNDPPFDTSLRVVVHNLRHRLKAIGSSLEIATVYGEGYVINTKGGGDEDARTKAFSRNGAEPSPELRGVSTRRARRGSRGSID
jgi:DNA-binding winged helix-turn-helix (wHTH) protein